MDPIKNPYSPGAGAPPPELVGRNPILLQADILLGRILAGKPEKSLLMIGLRGVGKTVLLNEIQRRAETLHYQTIFIEAQEEKPFATLLVPYLRTMLYGLDRMAKVGNKVKKALAVLRSFVSALKFTYGDISLGIDIEPEIGSADSGDLEIDLPQLFVAIGEAALDRQCAVAVFIDELQYLSRKELGALIVAMHKLQQKQLPMLLMGAGLPTLPGLAGESKSYAERLFNFPAIGQLSKEDSYRALQDPAKAVDVEFTQDALAIIFQQTKGYPYFLQEWGYKSWNQADSSPITANVVNATTPEVITQLDNNFFKVRFNRLTTAEKKFLRIMAELGQGPYKTSDLAQYFNLKSSTLSPLRASLMKKGMIYSPFYGYLDFTVPLFDEFMKRTMPD